MTRSNGKIPAEPLPASPVTELQQVTAYLRHQAECTAAIMAGIDRLIRLTNIAAAAAVAEPSQLPGLREKLRILIETDGARLSHTHAGIRGAVRVTTPPGKRGKR